MLADKPTTTWQSVAQTHDRHWLTEFCFANQCAIIGRIIIGRISLHDQRLRTMQAGLGHSHHLAATRPLDTQLAQVPAFGKIRQHQQQRKLSTREKLKYEYRMMTTAFSGRLPIVAADPAEAQVQRLAQICSRSFAQGSCLRGAADTSHRPATHMLLRHAQMVCQLVARASMQWLTAPGHLHPSAVSNADRPINLSLMPSRAGQRRPVQLLCT